MNEKQISTMIVNLQLRLLDNLLYRLESHFINDCVEDFNENQKGFESGLRICIDELASVRGEVQRPNTSNEPQPARLDSDGLPSITETKQ